MREAPKVPSSWDDPNFLGGGSGPVAEAVDFAREIAVEWDRRVVVRMVGRTNDGTRLMWDVFAAEPDGVQRP